MEEIKDTTLRYLAMLKMIPRYPGSIDISLILEKLQNQGFKATIRTIQRDLNKLSVPFPLISTPMPGSRANLWSWAEEADLMDIPEMSPLTALTFSLVKSFLGKLLPVTVLNYLNPHFQRAENLLGKLHSSHFGRWHEKIRIIPRGQQLLPAPINPTVLETVYDALLQEKQFEAVYKARDSTETKTYNVHPLGLVFRHEIIYLVCTIRDYKDVIHLPLHRFLSAKLIQQPRDSHVGFNLDDFINKGDFSYPVKQESLRIKAVFDNSAAAHLFETPLSKDQEIERINDESVKISATVKDTSELRWWLLGFGDKVEVLSPETLRQEFAEMFSRLHTRYA